MPRVTILTENERKYGGTSQALANYGSRVIKDEAQRSHLRRMLNGALIADLIKKIHLSSIALNEIIGECRLH